MELAIDFGYTLLLLSLLSAILATPTPVKLLWLDLNLPAHENIAGSQSAGTLSNARMETPFEIPTEDRTSNLHHLSVTGARKRQRVDQTTTLPGAKPLLQAESGTFCASIRGNPFEDSVSKGADRFPSNDRKKKKAKTRRLKKYKLKESDLANPGQSFDVYDWSFEELLSKDRRKAALYDTSLSLSNTKINLDQYRFASQDILQDIEIKLQSMLPNTIIFEPGLVVISNHPSLDIESHKQ
ncbi:hypothetical protein H4Q26_017207 [Puccinia striiformis f. sp. tritici PST-130]|nr:hypothetical protein H4Q26_017207 [Puccinia striiformis f. sp. tritici PST-130]